MAIAQAWSYQSARHPGILHLLRTLFFVSAQHSFIVRLVHLPGKTEPHCRRSFPQPVVTIFCPCPTGQPTANPSTSLAGRALSHQMEQLLSRALAPSTSNTYKIRRLKQRLFKSTPKYKTNLVSMRDQHEHDSPAKNNSGVHSCSVLPTPHSWLHKPD